jgi:hypothetical protein
MRIRIQIAKPVVMKNIFEVGNRSRNHVYEAVLWIRIFGHPGSGSVSQSLRGTDPDPSIISLTFLSLKNYVNVRYLLKVINRKTF